MAMPEATVDEDRSAILREDDVRTPGKLPFVHTKEEPCPMQVAANHKLRLGVTAADGGHHSRPGAWIDYVRHVIDCARRAGESSRDCFSTWAKVQSRATMCILS
jgi:hypothetical protein